MPRLRRPRSLLHTARRAAAVVLVVTALVLALRPEPVPARAREPATVPVVVAAADLPAGAVLADDDLAVVQFPEGVAPDGAQSHVAELTGWALASAVRAGEPLTDVRLVGPGVTALLGEGQVAAPVRLADLAVAGMVRTGDRVDVLATPPDAELAEVVAAGALVLAAARPVPEGTDPAAGLLLLAVDAPTAARLAAAATTATLTVSLPPPHESEGR